MSTNNLIRGVVSELSADVSEYFTSGLNAEVEILIDRWGVPHIYAQSKNDVYFAQGFNAARDRLWQLDFNRRRGLGKLSEIFGESMVDWDRGARRLIYRGDMRAEWLAYSNEAKSVVTRFVDGINAFIELTETGAVELPTEFTNLGYKPERWEPQDVARMRAHSLSFNASSEVNRAFIAHNWDLELDKLRKVVEDDHEIQIPENVDYSNVTPAILREYDYGTLPIETAGLSLQDLEAQQLRSESDGSNNWVIAGDKTSTGRPILANDPHRVTSTLPSLRYLVHLSCPEFDVIGGGEPLLPGISIGHNGKLAFGLTIFAIDQEDIFLHALNPENPHQYLYNGEWRSFDIFKEEIRVRGSSPVPIELLYSVHGPVMYHDPTQNFAVSLGAAWLEPGGAPYLGSMEYMTANTIDDFLNAMNRWNAPPENQIVADTSGEIAWKPGGIIPKRNNWDGLLPVPGDGSYQWDGFYDTDVLPYLRKNTGYIVTANNRLLGPEHDADVHVTYEWYHSYRAQRIESWLEENDGISVEEAFRFQMDDMSVAAAELIELLRSTAGFMDHPLGEEFSKWNCRLDAESQTAFRWERWTWTHLAPRLFSARIKELGYGDQTEEILRVVLPQHSPDRDMRTVINECQRLEQDSLSTIIAETLADAWDEINDHFADTTWGDVHTAYARHPLADLLVEAGVDERLVQTPERPVGGNSETPGLAAYLSDEDYRKIAGSTFRVAIDVGAWDNSLALNSPAQSGDLTKGQDLFDRWVDGEPFPLLYSRNKIQEATEHTLRLIPNSRADKD